MKLTWDTNKAGFVATDARDIDEGRISCLRALMLVMILMFCCLFWSAVFCAFGGFPTWAWVFAGFSSMSLSLALVLDAIEDEALAMARFAGVQS